MSGRVSSSNKITIAAVAKMTPSVLRAWSLRLGMRANCALIKSSSSEAAPTLERIAEDRSCLDPVGLGVEVGEAYLEVFCPIRHEAPARQIEAALAGLSVEADDWLIQIKALNRFAPVPLCPDARPSKSIISKRSIMRTGYHVYSEKQRQIPMPKRMRVVSLTEPKLKLEPSRTLTRLHKCQAIVAVSVLILLLMTAWSERADAAVTIFTDATTYFAQAGAQTLQDFNSPISNTATSVTYSDMVVSCSGTDFCSSRFFYTVSSPSITGLSVFGSGPAPITFTLNSPVTSFGFLLLV